MAALGFTTAATPLPVIVALTLLSGIVRSIAMTVYDTVGFADMPAGQMRDANTLFSTTSQLANGLAVAVATVAFVLLAVIAAVACAQALRLRPEAGSAARAVRPAPASASPGAPGE